MDRGVARVGVGSGQREVTGTGFGQRTATRDGARDRPRTGVGDRGAGAIKLERVFKGDLVARDQKVCKRLAKSDSLVKGDIAGRCDTQNRGRQVGFLDEAFY